MTGCRVPEVAVMKNLRVDSATDGLREPVDQDAALLIQPAAWSTVLPMIVGELRGLDDMTRIITGYALTSSIVIPPHDLVNDLPECRYLCRHDRVSHRGSTAAAGTSGD